MTDRSIKEQLAPMLHSAEQPVANELKERAWYVVEPLVTLDDAEREYIDRIHDFLRAGLLRDSAMNAPSIVRENGQRTLNQAVGYLQTLYLLCNQQVMIVAQG
ncbi:hypothetical protein MNBD_GAMMA13-1333 [hydrothermal vent metagenome]|uniref:Uncharacterized protein n=1 Tax=hydrothermal vent metagenome TaxID=652676 RepID=A0A3B0Z7S2_9ZZZZ